MKKIALTSLLAVFVASGANAANVIDNNPLYRLEKGHFYSITGAESETQPLLHENGSKEVVLSEEFAYGLTNNWMAIVKTSVTESDWFDTKSWDNFSVGLNYRAIDMGSWKADLFGSYAVNNVRADRAVMLDKDLTFYTWTAGVRGGYVGNGWTVAGHVAFDYNNTESFNWDEKFKDEEIGSHLMRFGLDGQLVLNQYWNLVAGVEYNADYDKWSDNVGYWKGTVGANLNLDETKFIGVYMSKYMAHEEAGNWEVVDGFTFGAKFGIDF